MATNWKVQKCQNKNKKVSACCQGCTRSNPNWVHPWQRAGTPQKNKQNEKQKTNKSGYKLSGKLQSVNIKTKKCQPAARGAPDLIQTECTPDRGLARHKKINRTKKIKPNESVYKLSRLSMFKIQMLSPNNSPNYKMSTTKQKSVSLLPGVHQI